MDNILKKRIGLVVFIIGTQAILFHIAFDNDIFSTFIEALKLEPLFLCITLLFGIIYTLIPFIVRLINKKWLKLKSGFILCTLNNIILAGGIITFIKATTPTVNYCEGSANPTELANLFIEITLGLAIVFYIINLCIFVDSKKMGE